jgi:hypothetical protein
MLKENSKPASIDDFLLIEMSRRNTDMVADLVMQKPALFDELFQAFLRNEEPVSRRAAWVVDIVTEKFPELLIPHLGHILSMLPKFKHDGLKRHSLRMLDRSPLPDGDELGKLITICFEWLLSPREAVAVKIYCMDLLFRISRIEPDLKNELADSIEYRMREETAGFKNRGQKMLDKLYSELNSP